MHSTFHFHELDDATRAFLLDVNRTEGAGKPGLYLAGSSGGKWGAFGIGVGLLVLCFILTQELNAGPLRVSLLQAAFLLPALWLVALPFRLGLAKGMGRCLDKFVYADRKWLWVAAGYWVEATEVQSIRGVTTPTDGKNAKGALLTVKLADGTQSSFQVGSESQAEQLTSFLESEEGGVESARDELSPDPARRRHKPSGFLGCIGVVACAAALVWALTAFHRADLEDSLYRHALNGKAPDLRSYLLDPSHQKHRKEIEDKLAALYAPVIEKSRKDGKDPKLSAAFRQLLDRISRATVPLVTLSATLPGNGAAALVGPSIVTAEDIRQEVAKSLPGAIGHELIEVIQAIPDVPAMIEIVASVTEPSITIRIRPVPDGEAGESKLSLPMGQARAATGPLSAQEIAKLLTEAILGEVQVQPIPPPAGAGGFFGDP